MCGAGHRTCPETCAGQVGILGLFLSGSCQLSLRVFMRLAVTQVFSSIGNRDGPCSPKIPAS